MPATKFIIRNELWKKFQDTPLYIPRTVDSEATVEDVVEFQYLLANGPASVDRWLHKLESNMTSQPPFSKFTEKEVQKAQEYFESYRKRQGTPQRSKFSHLLTKELSRIESKEGYTLLDNGKVKVYLNVLPSEVFRQESEKRMHFKDLVSARHGEFTHRIQWYIAAISESIKSQRASSLFVQVNQIFADLPNNVRQSLFQNMVDRVPANYNQEVSPGQVLATDPFDFRSPENFNDYLTSDDALGKFPVISSFLRHRKQKRESLTDNGFSPFEYMAQKLYKRNYSELPPESHEFRNVNYIVTKRAIYRYTT